MFAARGRLPTSLQQLAGFVPVVLVRRVRSVLFICGRLFPGRLLHFIVRRLDRLFLFYRLLIGLLPGWFFNRRGRIAFRLGCRSGGNRLACLALRFVILRSGCCSLMRDDGWLLNLRWRGRGNGFRSAGSSFAANRRLDRFSRRDFVAHPLAGLIEPVLQFVIGLLGTGLDAVPSGFSGVRGISKLLI